MWSIYLSLIDIHISLEDMDLLLDRSTVFEWLEITNACTLSAESKRANFVFLRLAETMASCWRKKADNRVRKLILDGVHIPFLHLIVHAVCIPNYADVNDMYTAIASNDIYFSATGAPSLPSQSGGSGGGINPQYTAATAAVNCACQHGGRGGWRASVHRACGAVGAE